MFPQLFQFTDVVLLLVRLMTGAIFVASGVSHLKDPEARAKSIGMTKSFTLFLGLAEVAGGLGVTFGVLTQLAAAGLVLIMMGAIQKKVMVWKTGFWGKHGTDGWHYDLMLVIFNLLVIVTNGGRFVLLRGWPF